jgi:hypothetical protein
MDEAALRDERTSGAKARIHLAANGTSKLVPFPFSAGCPAFCVFAFHSGTHCVGDAKEIKTRRRPV